MGTSFAVVFQTVGLAALLEAERAARSIAAHSPALVAAKRLELVAVGDAATLRGRSAGLRIFSSRKARSGFSEAL